MQLAASMSEYHLTIRLPKAEMEILQQYCHSSNRTKSGVIREFIRSLTDQKAATEANTSSYMFDTSQQPVIVSVEQAPRISVL